MKKSVWILVIVILFTMVFNFGSIYAVSTFCNLDVSLINQDPYPAVQGDTVKLLFQMSGVENPKCKGAVFKIDTNYAFSLTENNSIKTLIGGTYTENYKDYWTIPYTLKVNKNALDGDNQIKVHYSSGPNMNDSSVVYFKFFNISVQDSRADFEVYVQNYDFDTNTITLQVLNIAKVDVKAITIIIPEQENIILKGSNINIIGDLDSNEYTTASFKAIPSNDKIFLNISYTDQANVRRNIQKSVDYNYKYFEKNKKSLNKNIWITLAIISFFVFLVIYLLYKRKQKKKRIEERRKRIH